jgi:hypothetical protein
LKGAKPVKFWRMLSRMGVILLFALFMTTCEDDYLLNSIGELNQVKPLKSGKWTSTTDFGEFNFIVNSDGTEIILVTYILSDWTCGCATINGSVISSKRPGWSINDRKFFIENDFDMAGNQRMTIKGYFSNSGDKVYGTFDSFMYGTTCTGKWRGGCTE